MIGVWQTVRAAGWVACAVSVLGAMTLPVAAQNSTGRAAPVDNAGFIEMLDRNFAFSQTMVQLTATGCEVPVTVFEQAFNAAVRAGKPKTGRKGGGTFVARTTIPMLIERGLAEYAGSARSMLRLKNVGNCS